MDLEALIKDYPYIAVIAGAVLGVILGACISIGRWCKRRRAARANAVAPMQPQDSERPWECIELMLRLCSIGNCRRLPRGICSASDILCQHAKLAKVVIIASLVALTFSFDIAGLAFAAILRTRLQEMRANLVGDVEKTLVDECMRDFEGLPAESATYQENHRLCVEKLEGMDRLRWLPSIRLTVDERLCEPSQLCSDFDPGRCADEGGTPGDVSQCYQWIDQFKAEREHTRRAQLLDMVEQRCTGKESWSQYEHRVQLNYCMWKHLTMGVCMNSMRTNCPGDSSCCPIAQNHPGATARPNQYTCQKSPLVGLYCQHIDYVVPGSNATSQNRPMCSDVSCPSFAWCRDLADVPGLCLGEPCSEYRRSLDVALAIAVAVAAAVVAELVYVALLCRRVPRQILKGVMNAVAAGLKMMAYFLCAAGGLQDFMDEAVTNQCFNPEGNARVAQAQRHVKTTCLLLLLATAGSVCLSPLSVRWGSGLLGVPHAKSRLVI